MIGECLRCKEIKKLTRGFCSTKCYCYLKRHHLIDNLPKKVSPEFLSEIQRGVLIGSLLGDGCLFKHKHYQPYFNIARKRQDFQFLNFEFDLFKDFCNCEPKNYEVYDKRTKKTYSLCKFHTRPSKVFQDFYEKWYVNGIKVLPAVLELTPLICGIWFCDDGCVVVDKRKRLKLKLATHCFTLDENRRLQSLLSSKFSEYFSIGTDNGKHFLTAADSGTKKFIQFIEPHIYLTRKIKWTQESFNMKKAPAHLKNRNIYDLNTKELSILEILSNSDMSPLQLANEMAWHTSKGTSAPSGLTLYLNRFIKYKWLEKYGTPHSYKNGVKYRITLAGLEAHQKSLMKAH